MNMMLWRFGLPEKYRKKVKIITSDYNVRVVCVCYINCSNYITSHDLFLLINFNPKLDMDHGCILDKLYIPKAPNCSIYAFSISNARRH